MWLRCLLPELLTTIYSMKRIKLASQGVALLGFFLVCNIIFPIIYQADILLPL